MFHNRQWYRRVLGGTALALVIGSIARGDDPAPVKASVAARSAPTTVAPADETVPLGRAVDQFGYERADGSGAVTYYSAPGRRHHDNTLHSWLFRFYAGEIEMQEKVPYPSDYWGAYYFRPWKPDWIYPLPPAPVRMGDEGFLEYEARRKAQSSGTLRK